MERLNSMVIIIVLMAGSFLFVSGEDTHQKTLFENFEKMTENKLIKLVKAT